MDAGGEIRVGILGAASIAPWAMLLPAAAHPDVCVTAIAARDPARARLMAIQYGVPTVAETYAELLQRDDVDLVYVALPVSLHAEWTIKALEAGKAVLCEKPFAMNAEEARLMVAAAVQAKRPLLEAIHYRFHAATERARVLVGSGALGRLVSARGTFVYPVPWSESEIRWRADLGGGAVMDDGCYPIHALRTLLSQEPAVVSARWRHSRGVDAETRAELRFGDIPASIHVSLETDVPMARLEIIGERGRLQVRSFITPQWGGGMTLQRDDLDEELDVGGLPTWEAQLAHVVEVLQGRAEPLTGGIDAISNMTVIDAIKRIAIQEGPQS